MSQPAEKPSPEKWTVTVNESYSRDEVFINLDLVKQDTRPGAVMAMHLFRPDAESGSLSTGRQSSSLDRAFKRVGDDKRYVFVVKDMPKELKARYPTVEVYVAKSVADAFGLRKGSQVSLTAVDATNPTTHASHVELSFKDQYLSRADMWSMAVGELAGRTVFRGQGVHFLSTAKALVTAVYVHGRKVHSAFFGPDTRPIFRSDSARFVLFIQMAREMWDFDSDGSGEIMFNKVVNGFLPTLFKKWADMGVRHIVSIVLFARVEYDTGILDELTSANEDYAYYTGFQTSGNMRPYKDFYRVVVSEMASYEWTTILYQLKREFNHFRRDISTHHLKTSGSGQRAEPVSPREACFNRMTAEASQAMYGNFLEAINMASSLFAHDYVDRDLTRTGISVVIISPGSGVFEVEYDALRRTTEALVGNGIGIDLICIPKMPLHAVPLFRFRTPQAQPPQRSPNRRLKLPSYGSAPRQSTVFGSYNSFSSSVSPSQGTEGTIHGTSIGSAATQDEWSFAIPQWLHVSYWTGSSQEALSYQGIALSVADTAQAGSRREFVMRCKMYALQMRSVMETNEIETKPLHLDPDFGRLAARETKTWEPKTEPDSFISINTTHVPGTLFEHVYGFQKSRPDKVARGGKGSVWQNLLAYDDAKAKLPLAPKTAFIRQRNRDPDGSPKRHVMEDSRPLGAPVGQAGQSGSHRPTATGARRSRRPSTRFPTVTETATAGREERAARALRDMPHISFGERGFGIATAKVAGATVTAERASASISLAAKMTLPFLTSSMLSSDRPSSSRTSTVRTNRTNRKNTRNTTNTTTTPTRDGSATESRTPETSKSVTTSKAIPIVKKRRAEPFGYERDPRSTFQVKAEAEKRSKLLAEAVPELPATLFPATALSTWLTVLNPSKPESNPVDMATLYNRWQHVFVRPSKMRVMKWKSLCSPAAVPLTTEYFPTKMQLESEYQRQPYNITRDYDESADENTSRDDLLRELICSRFSQGFQIVVGPSLAKAFSQKQLKVADIFSPEHRTDDGTSIFMSVGNTIHQLSCVNGSEVEVNIFVRKPTESVSGQTSAKAGLYKPAIRTLKDAGYETEAFDLVAPTPERNWNYIDSFLAGQHDGFTEQLRFWRTRFVLLPTDGRHAFVSGPQPAYSEDENRIEGIRKLTQLWQRHEFIPPNERRFQPSAGGRNKDPNPLDIVYDTEDPSTVIALELETLPLLEGVEGSGRRGQLVTSGEVFSTKKINLAGLAEAMQQPVENGGVRMQNRRWYKRLHHHCFVGSDMTSWLLDNFEDLEDRGEAEAFGNRLMNPDDDHREREGCKETRRDGGALFVHVDRRHPFRDGNYYYRISSEYAKQAQGWFNARRVMPSLPWTPSTDVTRDGPSFPRPVSFGSLGEASPVSGASTPAAGIGIPGGKKAKVVLSKVIKYDVGRRKRSNRPEIVTLHFDRLYNPDNCYHVRIEWMNVTSKLIEDAISEWAQKAALPHGLKLVQVPIAEACRIAEFNPFRKPYRIQLAVPPPSPDSQSAAYHDAGSYASSYASQRLARPHYYLKALLKHLDYVLDFEAASDFPVNVDVSYTWGPSEYKYPQYIHQSGTVVVQITDKGDLIALANRMYKNRASQTQRETADQGGHSLGSGVRNVTPTPFNLATDATPISSPLAKPAYSSPAITTVNLTDAAIGAPSMPGTASAPATATWSPTAESMIEALEAFCHDAPALEAFFAEQLLERARATPALSAAGSAGVPDGSIPVLGLPPPLGTAIMAEGHAAGSPRAGSPALLSQQRLRTGSVRL